MIRNTAGGRHIACERGCFNYDTENPNLSRQEREVAKVATPVFARERTALTSPGFQGKEFCALFFNECSQMDGLIRASHSAAC